MKHLYSEHNLQAGQRWLLNVTGIVHQKAKNLVIIYSPSLRFSLLFSFFCWTQINVFEECFWCKFLSKQWKIKTSNLLYIMTHAPIRFDVFATFGLCLHKFINDMMWFVNENPEHFWLVHCSKWTYCFRKELWIWITCMDGLHFLHNIYVHFRAWRFWTTFTSLY